MQRVEYNVQGVKGVGSGRSGRTSQSMSANLEVTDLKASSRLA